MLLLLRQHRLERLQGHQLIPVVLMGLTGILTYNICFFTGLQLTTASRASLIVTTNPAVIALGAAVLFGDKLTVRKVLGIVMALSGAAVVIARGNPLAILLQGLGPSDLWLIGCIVSWSLYTLANKQAVKSLSPLAATTYACFVGTPLLLPLALSEGLLTTWQTVTPAAWLGLLFLGSLGTVLAFYWYAEGLRVLGAARAAIFISLIPVAAVILAALVLHEPLSPVLFWGGGLVVAGVTLTNRG